MNIVSKPEKSFEDEGDKKFNFIQKGIKVVGRISNNKFEPSKAPYKRYQTKKKERPIKV